MQRNKVKKCLLALVLSLTVSLAMLPSGVRAEEIDSEGSGEPKVEDAQGEGQNKAEDKKEAEDTDKKVSDAVKEENKDSSKEENKNSSNEGKVQNKAVLKAVGDAGNQDSDKSIEAKAEGNTIYLNDAISAGASDSNDGLSKDKPVKTFDKAYELAGKGGTIIICDTTYWIEVNHGLSDVTIKLDEDYDTSKMDLGSEVIKIGGNVTFTNVTIDGNKANAKVAPTYSPLVYVGPSSELTIIDTIIENNGCWGVDCGTGGKFTMEGSSSIRNNEYDPSGDWEYGGGMRVNDGGVAYLNGGTIEGNSAIAGGGIYISTGTVYLNGTEIKNNTATTGNGGAIHMVNDNYKWSSATDVHSAKLVMTGGSITNNKADWVGGAISAWDCRGGDTASFPGDDYGVIIDISGGTISDNTSESDGSAIALRGYYNGDVSYSNLRLSGAPTISGDVYLQEHKDVNKGAMIDVTGEFMPSDPVIVTDDNGIVGRDIIKYVDGVTPDLSVFVSGWDTLGIRRDETNSQVLEWGDEVPIWFVGKDSSQEKIMATPGSVINPASIPEMTSKGYTLDGWTDPDGNKWDMANDVVTNEMTLTSVWKLNAPEVTIKADKTEAKPGETITLTAIASHDIKGLPCTYVWYKDGKEIKGETGSTLNVTDNGNYSVKIMITDAEGLTAEGMSKEVKCTFSDQASASGNAGNGSNGKGNTGTNGSVKTGDEAQGILYLVVLLAALGAGTVVVLRRRARQF